ncbi:hypothetical protein [Halorubrum salinum]|uniref:hypothetical protein n=1 Tax=Halorubrum salinum TaxID=767517 RepID=UPI002111FE6A|nr:hypothetical protein [Halorubrum salinum]
MMTLYCAICGGRFEPDDYHRWVDAEEKPGRESFTRIDSYALHVDCWDRLTAGWMDPA